MATYIDRELVATIEWDANKRRIVPFTRIISSVDVRANGGYAAIGKTDKTVIELAVNYDDGELLVFRSGASFDQPVMLGVSVYDNTASNVKAEAIARLAILFLPEFMTDGLHNSGQFQAIAYRVFRNIAFTQHLAGSSFASSERGVEFFYTDNDLTVISEMASLEAMVVNKLREHGIGAETRVRANAFRLAALIALLAHLSSLSNFDKRYAEYFSRYYMQETSVFDLNEINRVDGKPSFINKIEFGSGAVIKIPGQTYIADERAVVAGSEVVLLKKVNDDSSNVCFLTDIRNNGTSLDLDLATRTALIMQSKLLHTIAASYEIAAMMGATDEQMETLERVKANQRTRNET